MLSASDLVSQPATQARALPAPAFVDASIGALERRAVFARGWHVAAHVSQLAAAGDHVVLTVADVPLIVVRGLDGVLRALHNVCRHRAGPLAECDGRGARALHCRYHGWTYELDGRLRAAHEMTGAQGFDAASTALPPAHVAVWQGLVFVALDPATEFAADVAGIAERVARDGGAPDWSRFEHAGRDSYDMACNWKLYVDNYLEGYHVPHVHPALNRQLDYRAYRTETAGAYSLQTSPLRDHPGRHALYYWLWPATMLNCLPDRLQTNRVEPTGADRCRVVFDYYYDPRVTAAARAADRRFSDAVQREDSGICEAVQRNLAAGSYTPGPLSLQRESGLHHFHERWRAALRAAD